MRIRRRLRRGGVEPGAQCRQGRRPGGHGPGVGGLRRQAAHRDGRLLCPQPVPGRRRQDRRGMGRRAGQGGRPGARPGGRAAERPVRHDRQRSGLRQVRPRRLLVHDQPGADQAGQHAQLLQRRHVVGGPEGQSQQHHPGRRLRLQDRRPAGHRAGRRRHSAFQGLHRCGQGRDHDRAVPAAERRDGGRRQRQGRRHAVGLTRRRLRHRPRPATSCRPPARSTTPRPTATPFPRPRATTTPRRSRARCRS